MTRPRVGSLFSGVGGFDLGLERAGFEIAFQCDNDPFCNKVLAKHWPGVTRYGDVRDITLASTTGEQQLIGNRISSRGAVCKRSRLAIICGGFPCQDLSVAGKRKGLAGERSGLWFEFHRILSELRPTFALIENVPGLLSSNEGRDFAVVLAGLGELWPAVGWAVLDSQHFGVPQRRRRVYVIAGSSRECVQQILSLCEGGDWNTQARRTAGQDVAYALNAGVRGTGDGHGNAWNSNYVANALMAKSGYRLPADSDTLIPSLQASGPPSTRRDDEARLIVHPLTGEGFDASEDGTGRGTPIISVRTAQTGSNGWGIGEDGQAYTLDGTSGQAVAASTVRRLTPVECERLQGFPDDWTKLDDSTPDSPRYKACGNAVSVPVIEYIGKRIMEVIT